MSSMPSPSHFKVTHPILCHPGKLNSYDAGYKFLLHRSVHASMRLFPAVLCLDLHVSGEHLLEVRSGRVAEGSQVRVNQDV